MNILKSEFIKLKRSPIWIAFFILPTLSAIMGTFNYLQNVAILKDEWYSLWTQHTLFLSYFFLPILIGLISSYLYRLENLSNNWNAFMTVPRSYLSLFLGKFYVCSTLALMSLTYVGILFLACGYIIDFTGFPLEIMLWLVRSVPAVLAVVAIQLLLSQVIKNFAIPVGLSFILGILGLIMIQMELWHLSPYALIAISLNSNGSSDLPISMYGIYILSTLIFTVSSIFIATIFLRKKDIVTK